MSVVVTKSILDVPVGCYRSYTDTTPVVINLMSFLTSAKYKDRVSQIRRLTSKKERDRLKRQLPAITPSGTFSYRQVEGLIRHSGLMQFDIDFKDNQHIGNYENIKEQLKNIRNVAYCGLSVSGTGYWGLVPIAYPERHNEHFLALQQAFGRLGINIDGSCKDVSRLRGYSYDPEAYFNPQAKTYYDTAQPVQVIRRGKTVVANTGAAAEKVQLYLEQIKERRVDITGTYQQWFEIGCSLANHFGEGGREYFHEVSCYHPDYCAGKTDRQFDECLKHQYAFTIKTFYHYCKLAGLSSCKEKAAGGQDRAVANMQNIDGRTLQYRGTTKLGAEFDYLQIQCADDEKYLYRFLTTFDEEHAIGHSKAQEVAVFFGFDFQVALLDGERCLVYIE